MTIITKLPSEAWDVLNPDRKLLLEELATKKFSFSLPAKIRKLAFMGGGGKGIVYIGAIKELEEEHILEDVDTVAGSSAGGITALMLSIGMSAAEIEFESNKTDFGKFKDYKLLEISKRGLCRGDALSAHIQRLIETYLPRQIDYAKQCALEGIGRALKNQIKVLSTIKEGSPLLEAYQKKCKSLEKQLQFYMKALAIDPENEEKINRLLETIDVFLIDPVLLEKSIRTEEAGLTTATLIMSEESDEFDKRQSKILEKIQLLKNLQKQTHSLEIDNIKNLIKQYRRASEIDIKEVTFSDMTFLNESLGNTVKRLTMTGTNITDVKAIPEIFSDENTPDMPIRTAARITGSFPLLFQAVKYNGKFYIDGGVTDNLPVRWIIQEKRDLETGKSTLYERINETLSFGFSVKEIEQDATGIFSTLKNLFHTIVCGRINPAETDAELQHALKNDFSSRFIELPVDIDTLDFDISLEKKLELQKKAQEKVHNNLCTIQIVEKEMDLVEYFLTTSKQNIKRFLHLSQNEQSIAKSVDEDNTAPWKIKIREREELLFNKLSLMYEKNDLTALGLGILAFREQQENYIREFRKILREYNAEPSSNFSDLNNLECSLRALLKTEPWIKINDQVCPLAWKENHIQCFYEKIKDACKNELDVFYLRTSNDMSLLDEFPELKKIHQSIRFDDVKKSAIDYLIRVKVKPFQNQTNVKLINSELSNLHQANDPAEFIDILEKIKLAYNPRNIFRFNSTKSELFKPITRTAFLMDDYINRINSIYENKLIKKPTESFLPETNEDPPHHIEYNT